MEVRASDAFSTCGYARDLGPGRPVTLIPTLAPLAARMVNEETITRIA